MNHQEFRIHVAIVKHIRDCFPQVGFFHPANEQKDATSAFFGKMLGVRAGTSDLVLGFRRENGDGCAGVLEIKSDEGKVSTAQNKFLSWADSVGWQTGVARSVRGAHMVLCSWGCKPKYHETSEPDTRSDAQKKIDAFNLYKRPE